MLNRGLEGLLIILNRGWSVSTNLGFYFNPRADFEGCSTNSRNPNAGPDVTYIPINYLSGVLKSSRKSNRKLSIPR
jgi:hypothetical protein